MPHPWPFRDNGPAVEKNANGEVEVVAADGTQARTETRELKETIASLREQLEIANASRADAMQRAVAGGREEVRQLQAAVQALREEMEAALQEHRRHDQEMLAAHRQETRQLQGTIAELRMQLEARRESPH